MTESLDLAGLAERLIASQGPRRRIVAVAGAPGSGKSTFAERLRDKIAERLPVEVVPMDGFHYDDMVLEARGWRPRKGAPHTFDVDGFGATLDRLRADDGRDVAIPVFDRSIEIARAGARIITPEARLLIAEGNYLLLDDPDWALLRDRFDATVFLDVPEDEIEARLLDRWQGYGLDEAAITAKLQENDLPNALLVMLRSVPADFVVKNVD
jgi:pantothenate kinase